MSKSVFPLMIVEVLVLLPTALRGAPDDDAKARNAVVKIFATIHQPDPYRPWTKTAPHEATGSGVVIAGKQILTDAHMSRTRARSSRDRQGLRQPVHSGRQRGQRSCRPKPRALDRTSP
jgi:hypothetical protein